MESRESSARLRRRATNVIKASQFVNDEPASVDETVDCDASSWYGEQSLDVEASHATAPGAKLLYVGATDCSTGRTSPGGHFCPGADPAPCDPERARDWEFAR